MKLVVVLIAVLALVAGVWWFSRAQDDARAPTVVDATTNSARDTDQPKNVAVGEGANPDDSAMTIVESDNKEVADTVSKEAADETPSSEGLSPFAIVGVETAAPEAAAVQSQANLPTVDDSTTTAEGDQRSLQPLEVPTSYPVTDAAKYFIPKEERGPGRLGGPPPLDFPGGPSDPDRVSNQGGVLPPPGVPEQ